MASVKSTINSIMGIKRALVDVIKDRAYMKDYSGKVINLMYELDDYSSVITVDILQKTEIHKCLKPLLNSSDAFIHIKEACHNFLDNVMRNLRKELFGFDIKLFSDIDDNDHFRMALDSEVLCNDIQIELEKINAESENEESIIRTDGKYLEIIKRNEMNMVFEAKRRMRNKRNDIDKIENDEYCFQRKSEGHNQKNNATPYCSVKKMNNKNRFNEYGKDDKKDIMNKHKNVAKKTIKIPKNKEAGIIINKSKTIGKKKKNSKNQCKDPVKNVNAIRISVQNKEIGNDETFLKQKRKRAQLIELHQKEVTSQKITLKQEEYDYGNFALTNTTTNEPTLISISKEHYGNGTDSIQTSINQLNNLTNVNAKANKHGNRIDSPNTNINSISINLKDTKLLRSMKLQNLSYLYNEYAKPPSKRKRNSQTIA